jgi:integrase
MVLKAVPGSVTTIRSSSTSALSSPSFIARPSRLATVKQAVIRAGKRIGVKVSPHVLRHTAAVLMAEDGVSMEEIARYMGHRDSLTTERIYARFSPEYLMKAAKALEL